MSRFIKILAVIFLVVGAITFPALAAEKKFEVNLDKTRVSIGDRAQLGLSFQGTQSMPAPDLGNIDGLDVKYVGPSTMMTVINGQVSSSVTHMYSVQPLKIGKFQLGPFTFKYKGDDYTSNMVFLESVEEKVMAAPQMAGANILQEMKLSDRIYLTLFVEKPAAYVNELIPVTVKLYVNRLNVSDIQLPSFDQEGFSKVEFKEPKQYRERVGGYLFDVLEFKTSIFGTRAGDYHLGPAKIKCTVMMPKGMPRGPMDDDFFPGVPYDDFFTRYERYPLELKSTPVQIAVLPVPTAGRPADFTGAVGDYQFVFNGSPTRLKVGDPVTVRMDINGNGNFNTVLMPKFENTSGFKTYEAQVKTEENRKSFTQVLIPESDSVTKIPQASFSFFDPNARQFKTITQGPIPIQVEKQKDEAPSQVIGPMPGTREPAAPENKDRKEPDLGRDIIYIKESPGIWFKRGKAYYNTGAFLMALIIPLLLFIAFWIYQRRQLRLKSDTAYAGRIFAVRSARNGIRQLNIRLKSADPKSFYEAVFETLQNYLGHRLHIPPAGMTSAAAVQGLAERGVDKAVISKVEKLFTACDLARFAYQQIDNYKMIDDKKELEEVLRYFERKKL
ncbi:MAG: protein BatD [Candidatus Omnitrophica bacterium]|nr:protein BatD [Candidatus Omnitrophota bacterium]